MAFLRNNQRLNLVCLALLNLLAQLSYGQDCGDFSALYRTADGTCNNIANPLQGKADSNFRRYLPPAYDDGVSVPRGELRDSSNALPSPRQVSVAINSLPVTESPINITLFVMQWGQFMDHDFTLTPEFEDSKEVEECCPEDDSPFIAPVPGDDNPCRAIDVRGDAFYAPFGVNCLRLVRSLNASTNNGVREQMNVNTAYIDGSQIYGSSQARADALRTFSDGRLKSGPGQEEPTTPMPQVFITVNGQNKTLNPTFPLSFLPLATGTDDLFVGGDVRVQEQPGLTSVHTVFNRAHNAIASKIAFLRPDYSDETIYQETRRIVGAMVEHITIAEFLPVVIGFDAIKQHNLGFSTYDPTVDSTIPNIFATAAFRFGHSLIQNTYMLRNANVSLARSFEQHNVTLKPNQCPSEFLIGLSNQKASPMDHSVVEAIRNFLFAQPPNFEHGSDLYSRNIQRGREHGIPGYNQWRQFCGLKTFTNFTELESVMPAEVAQAFSTIYKSVDDIDIFPPLIAEFPPNTTNPGIAGETLTCILGQHFDNARRGDRYWFENFNQPRPFTIEQQSIIKRTNSGSIICRYTSATSSQRDSMKLPDRDTNPRLPCSIVLQGTVPLNIHKFVDLPPQNNTTPSRK